jgi:hypothetical protein
MIAQLQNSLCKIVLVSVDFKYIDKNDYFKAFQFRFIWNEEL